MKNGSQVSDEMLFEALDKENAHPTDKYGVRNGKISGIKVLVGHRIKFGLAKDKEFYTLSNTRNPEKFMNYYWFKVNEKGQPIVFDDQTNEELGVFDKLTVVDKKDLKGAEQTGEAVNVTLPVMTEAVGPRHILKEESPEFRVFGDGKEVPYFTKDGHVNLSLKKNVKYTIMIMRTTTYKMDGFSFTLNDDGNIYDESNKVVESLDVYTGTSNIRIYVFKDGRINNFAEKGLRFQITEDGNPNNVQVKEFDGKFVDFEAVIHKSYIIKLLDTEKYTMGDVYITIEIYPGDGKFWPMIKNAEIPEGEDGKLKAFWLVSKNPGDYEEKPDDHRQDECNVFNDETVKTAPIDVEIKDGSDGKDLEFTLFNCTKQKFVGKYKLVDGKFPALDLINMDSYIIQLVNDEYKMNNAYIIPYANNLVPKFFKEQEVNKNLDPKRYSKLVISRKQTPSKDDGKVDAAFRVVKDGQNLDGIKIKFYSEYDVVEGISKDGYVKVRLIEDIQYVPVIEDEKYTTEIVPIVIKDKYEWYGDASQKPTFDHRSCGGFSTSVVYDKDKDSIINKGTATCAQGNTTLSGMNFGYLEVVTGHPNKMDYDILAGKDFMIYDIALVNHDRCERSKIAKGNFTIKRRIAANKEVKDVYYIKGDKLQKLEFEQSKDGEKDIVIVKVDSLGIYPLVVEYKSAEEQQPEKPVVPSEPDKPVVPSEPEKPYVPSEPDLPDYSGGWGYYEPTPSNNYWKKPVVEAKAEPKKEEKKAEPKKEVKSEPVVITSKFTLDSMNFGVNDSNNTMDVAPFAKDGRIMVPIRFVGMALGFDVSWDQATKTAILKDGKTEIRIPMNGKTFYVNGVAFEADAEPEIRSERIFLSISNIAKALGLEEGKTIFWDQATKTASFIFNK